MAKKREKKESSLSDAAAELGHAGGVKGGPARAAKLSAEQRREIAKKAAQVRWENQSRKAAKPSQKKKQDGK